MISAGGAHLRARREGLWRTGEGTDGVLFVNEDASLMKKIGIGLTNEEGRAAPDDTP